MGTRKWKYYKEPGTNGIKFGKYASGGYDAQLAKACAANYAETRRNVLGIITNLSGTVVCGEGTQGTWTEFIKSLPLGSRIIRPGKLTVQIYCSLSSEAAGNKIHVMAICGPDLAVTTSTHGGTLWIDFDIDLTKSPSSENFFSLLFKTEGANTVTIESVCLFQPGDTTAPDLVTLDTTNCTLGDADYPDDVFAMSLLRQNVAAVRGWKVPRGNVFSHSFLDTFAVTQASYAATADRLGCYKFVKRKGISVLKIHLFAVRGSGNNCDLQCTLSGSWTAAPTEGSAQSVLITNTGFGPLQGTCGYTLTFTFANQNDIDAELEIDARFDGKDDPAGTTWVAMIGVCCVEASPSVALAHTVPDVNSNIQGTNILASNHENIWKTCHSLWFYGGRQICFSDWRHDDNTFFCKSTLFDKRTYASGSVIYGSVIARAILFSSQDSKRLRVRMQYHTTSEAGPYVKTIHICTTKNIDEVHCTHIDSNPAYDDDPDGDNDHEFSYIVDGEGGRPGRMLESCHLDIQGTDQEEHWDGANEPPQVIVQGIVAQPNSTEYIIPDWILIEEISLEEEEFP